MLVGSDGSGSTLKAGSVFFCYTTWCFEETQLKPSKGIEKLTGLPLLRIVFLDKCVSELRRTGVSSFFDLFVGADES